MLSEEDICKLQEEDISRVSSVLSISTISSAILLRHYNWSFSNLSLFFFFPDLLSVQTDIYILKITTSFKLYHFMGIFLGVLAEFMMNGLLTKKKSDMRLACWTNLLFISHLMLKPKYVFFFFLISF